MEFAWQELFWVLIILGPYIMTYAWSLSFWIRLITGFVAISEATSQVIMLTQDVDITDPANPFGHRSQDYIALCIATGVSGGLFAAFAEPVGLLVLQLWGSYAVYTWAIVAMERFHPLAPAPSQDPPNRNFLASVVGVSDSNLWGPAICVAVSVCIVIFASRLCFRFPKWVAQIMAGIAGGPCGAHATVQAIYFYWNDSGMYGPVVYGLLAGNRSRWCFDPSSCKIFYTTFCVLCIVSWVTQYFVYVAEKQGKPWKAYAPVPFKHPNAGTVSVGAGLVRDGAESSEDEEEEDLLFSDCTGQDDSWAQNLTTPRSCWVFLTVVVAFSCAATFAFTYLVKWDEPTETNYFFGLVYILANAFCLWSIIEFFFTTLWFHTIRLICGMPGLPKQDFSHGLPRNGRTILAYCLLSKSKDSSEETFNTALQAHLANIDPNGRVTTSVVSVSSALSVVQCEMDCRDKGRAEIKRILGGEVVAIQRLFEAGDLADGGHAAKSVIRDALQALPGGSGDRANFWFAVLTNGRKRGTVGGPALMQVLLTKVEEAAQHFLYLHRTTKILKKPGQYQDLMVLGTTGNNRAYTYLRDDYGSIGREMDSKCFGFGGNVSADGLEGEVDLKEAVAKLEERGQEDVLRVAAFGADPKQRYFYTMVLDSDTICPVNSIRTLVETAEHPANRSFGIINATLANDYGADDKCTWYMWRNALMEVSTVNLQRGQFWIFNRVGFYGKGLIRNDMYISRVIGMPGSLIEALPIDILSHDTVEAKLLQPAVASDVCLYEEVARNPISALSQSTRWCLGEVRNGCYHADGAYTSLIGTMSFLYSMLAECKKRPSNYVRWRDVPCASSAEYLSHTGFRLFHAGPGILLVTMSTSLLAEQKMGLQLVVLPVVGIYAFIFTVLALFIVPKGFLILDKLPSLGLGKYCLCTAKASKIGDGSFSDQENEKKRGGHSRRDARTIQVPHEALSDEDSASEESSEDEDGSPHHLGRCSVLYRQLVLALVEILLSLLLFSPELIVGVIRLVRGAWAQVTGSASWQPQDSVEKEIEQSLSVWYVFKKTYIVFACGVFYLTYSIVFEIYDVLVYLLIVSWMLYPLTTYVMCLPVQESCKKSWLWTWVMDIKQGMSD